MSKRKKKKLTGTKIGAELLISVFCSLCVSGILFMNLYFVSNWAADKYSSTQYAAKKLSEFQGYVDSNRIFSSDFSTLTAWINKNDIKFMHIYRGDTLIFNSDDPVDDSYSYDERERDYYWDNRTITFIEEIQYVKKETAIEDSGEVSAKNDTGIGTGAEDTVTNPEDFTEPDSDKNQTTDKPSQKNEPDEPEWIGDGQSAAQQNGISATDHQDSTASDGIDIQDVFPGGSIDDATEGSKEEIIYSYDDIYDEVITYEPLNVFIAVGTDMRLLIILIIISVLICLIIFALLILRFIRNRVMYLTQLSAEVGEIESGMLEKSVTVKGNDEITDLAKNVDDMRISLVERLQSEKEAYDANRELITAMSHDLRTPLSALIGYLEIVNSGVYSSDEQKLVYIRKSIEKAYQLKTMSDKLFDYFTVFKDDASEDLNIEIYDGHELLSQIVSEQTYMLEEKGYTIAFEEFDTDGENKKYELSLDSGALLRVFDNIFSNILKYANKKEPIRIVFEHDENLVKVSVTNRINTMSVKVASTKIGLKSCRRLMSRMGGALKTHTDGKQYTITLILRKYNSQIQEGNTTEFETAES